MFHHSVPIKRDKDDPSDENINSNPDAEVQEDDTTPSSPKRPRLQDDDELPCCSRNIQRVAPQPQPTQQDERSLDRLREIISHEFSTEIKLKKAQLELVDERLEDAKDFLQRLRYAIVAEYYKKHELKQAMRDAAAAMRPESISVGSKDHHTEEQIPLHPSLKKIIGKKPKNLNEIMRACPRREAAKNATNVLNAKSAKERREERRLQKIIKEKGIVIDHSKQNIKLESNPSSSSTGGGTSTIVEALTNKKGSISTLESSGTRRQVLLNEMRTINKKKYHFVVGNTSKYIGKTDERSAAQTAASNSTAITHKWLVYVQTKDINDSIEKYVKKVRFFLHPSYRPNDVVDIRSPPFQVARRGWGEFPMRIQLFFHENFQQKPLQLVHKVVLDTTKSGRHTLGAETVLEIWLRSEETAAARDRQNLTKTENSLSTNVVVPSTNLTAPAANTTDKKASQVSHETNKKSQKEVSSLNIKETFDDNFFDFLNKIEESRTSICADIEKIEPTLLVNEPLEPQYLNSLRSPINKELVKKSPLKSTSSHSAGLTLQNLQNREKHQINQKFLPIAIQKATKKLAAAVNQAETKAVAVCEEGSSNDVNINQKIPSISLRNAITHISGGGGDATTSLLPKISSVNLNLTSTSITPPKKAFCNASGTVILPVVKKPFTIPTGQTTNQTNLSSGQSETNLSSSSSSKPVFQKKTVQVVNAQGQVRSIQMFIASSKSFPSTIGGAKSIATTRIAPNQSSFQPPKQETSSQKSNFIKPPTTHLPAQQQQQQPESHISTLSSQNHKHINTSINQAAAGRSAIKSLTTTTTTTTTMTMSSSKNVVFQKEGKLYIIDPLQMKLKQQRKNQISLLKPQVKQQTAAATSAIQSVASDHDYIPPPPSFQINSISVQSNKLKPSIRPLPPVPQVHFGMRDARRPSAIETQDWQEWQRIKFENEFNKISFRSMRSAIEFLLRRLPLIASGDKDSPSPMAFPFVRNSIQQFNYLPAFKQRSFEWLRAKFISRIIQVPKSLQVLHTSGEETYWTTREIANFARYYGYTPPMKALQEKQSKTEIEKMESGTKEHFSELIKNEIQNKDLQLIQYDTLSPADHIVNWIENKQQYLAAVNQEYSSDEIIIIDDGDGDDDGDDMCRRHSPNCDVKTTANDGGKTSKEIITKRVYGSPLKIQSNINNISYLPPPEYLETAFEYVGDVCKDISVRLKPEEIIPGIIHPSVQTILAHTSRLFIERLLRQTIASQALHEQEKNSSNCSRLPQNYSDRSISAQDIRKTIAQSSEFDFLTNHFMGVDLEKIKNEPS